MHRLLKQQLRQHFGEGFVPNGAMLAFLETVGCYYDEVDLERERVAELQRANEEVQRICSQSELELANEHALLHRIIDSVPDLIYFKNVKSVYLGCNRAFEEYFGVPENEIAGQTDFDFVDVASAAFLRKLDLEVLESNEARTSEEWITYPDGREICLETVKTPYAGADGKLLGLVAIGRNITERKRLEEALQRQANVDSLTGLATRRYFMAQVEKEMARAKRSCTPTSMLMFDLDEFKAINDRKGHHTGDQVLRTIGDICRRTLREVDIVGRMGGEEFAILLPATDGGQAHLVAERLRQDIESTPVYTEQGEVLHFTASIGVDTLDDTGEDIDAMLRQADLALYDAKRSGRNRVCVAGR